MTDHDSGASRRHGARAATDPAASGVTTVARAARPGSSASSRPSFLLRRPRPRHPSDGDSARRDHRSGGCPAPTPPHATATSPTWGSPAAVRRPVTRPPEGGPGGLPGRGPTIRRRPSGRAPTPSSWWTGTPSAGVREAVSRLAAEGPQAGIHVICLVETPAASPASPVTDDVRGGLRGLARLPGVRCRRAAQR